MPELYLGLVMMFVENRNLCCILVYFNTWWANCNLVLKSIEVNFGRCWQASWSFVLRSLLRGLHKSGHMLRRLWLEHLWGKKLWHYVALTRLVAHMGQISWQASALWAYYLQAFHPLQHQVFAGPSTMFTQGFETDGFDIGSSSILHRYWPWETTWAVSNCWMAFSKTCLIASRSDMPHGARICRRKSLKGRCTPGAFWVLMHSRCHFLDCKPGTSSWLMFLRVTCNSWER
jgi:hypothetical protein